MLPTTHHMSYIRSQSSIMLILVLCIAFFSTPGASRASTTSDIAVTPAVIDLKGKTRDIIKESIIITNTSDHQITLFPSVEDINVQSGSQTFTYAQSSGGLSDSLSNWIELSRGVVTLGPGEQREVPFVITVNENAISNIYHSAITFSDGDTRTEAEAKAPLTTVTVNLEVQADIKEEMQLAKFTSDNIVFSGDDVLFKYQLQNIGNQDLNPTGEISIYDRNGQEVASVDVNKEGKTISPNQLSQLASVWSAANGFGKFKAMLTVKYGASQTASVQDTVFFWIVPWKQILELFAVSLVAIVLLGLYFHRFLETHHLHKLARAGALKPEVYAQMVEEPVSVVPIPQIPSIPIAEVAAHVQAQVIEKREAFTAFKRQGFVSVPERVMHAQEEHHTQTEPTARSLGGTIDLSQMKRHVAAAPVTTQDHIINLKKSV